MIFMYTIKHINLFLFIDDKRVFYHDDIDRHPIPVSDSLFLQGRIQVNSLNCFWRIRRARRENRNSISQNFFALNDSANVEVSRGRT